MILVIDNYDSFIYNIVQYLGEFHDDIRVYRNDKITLQEALELNPDGIVISPGPGRPEDSNVSMELIKGCGDIPLFGVCLGHQGIALGYGGQIVGAKNIIHGKQSVITHNGLELFAGIESPFKAIRYHSLVARRETLPETLEITAESEDGEIMGVRVKGRDIYGVQFHPESILTENGKSIVKNYVDLVMKRKKDKAGQRVKNIIGRVVEGHSVSAALAEDMLDIVISDNASPSQIAAYLTALRIKGETPEEIAGSARSLFKACVKVKGNNENFLDIVGTGADSSGTFNISTTSSIVAAGAGVSVAKHGNRSVTSKSGSADVLEKLGVKIAVDPDTVSRCIAEAGIGFLFAPHYHPAMRYVMPTRRDIGFRTIFNILGPIVNPAGVKRQVMGVFSMALLDTMADVFCTLGHIHSLVLHGLWEGGVLDEASIEGLTHMREVKDGKISALTLDARDFGLDGKVSSLKVNSPDESAELVLSILKGKERGDPRKAVVLNAALGIYVAADCTLQEAVKRAESSIDDGRALAALETWARESNKPALAV